VSGQGESGGKGEEGLGRRGMPSFFSFGAQWTIFPTRIPRKHVLAVCCVSVQVLTLDGLFFVGLIARYSFRYRILWSCRFHGSHNFSWHPHRLRVPVMEYSSQHAHQNGLNWNRNGAKHKSPTHLERIRNQPSAFASLKILIRYSDRVAEMEMSTGVAAFLISTMF